MKFKIGNITIKNQVVLAPMAGISNPAYIKICEEMGCGYAITELISAEAIIRNNQKTFDMLKGIERLNIPVAVQLFGGNANTMARAAQIITNMYPIKIIDINMGCPVPKVALRSQAGSALLKNPDKVREIVKAVVDAVTIPVTVKIRSGWDQNSINATEIAKICEKAGASAICVHARTRSQGYSGKADWNIIKEVKEAVSIPVIGNGDIKDIYSAKKMLEEVNCDAVMIGRSALGNPWIIRDVVNYLDKGNLPKTVSASEKIDMCIKHFNYLLAIKNEKVAILEMRNHIAWYLKGLPKANEIKNKIYLIHKISDIINILKMYKRFLEGEIDEI